MQDFAAMVIDARRRAGLTQAQAAEAAGMTPSYLSLIENRKKPPPSDEACRRLAEVLGMPEARLIEAAHLERAPETLRRKVDRLNLTLRRERRSRLRALQRLLSPFLPGGVGLADSALDATALSPARRRRIREVLQAVGRKHADKERQLSRIVAELPERERRLLLEALPEVLGGDARRGAAREPPLRYAPPLPGEAQPSAPYMVAAEEGALDGKVLRGDRLVVDPAASPSDGDIVVLRGETGLKVRRVEARDGGFVLAGGPAAEAAAAAPLAPRDLASLLGNAGAGVVVEIRRRLRREGA